MVKRVADGISLIEGKAFQSFLARVYTPSRARPGFLSFTIPSAITRHLDLGPGDILEIAVRRVNDQYAKANYKITFLSFRAVCPICNEIGRVYQMSPHSYMFNHYKKGGVRMVHYISETQFQELKRLENVS